jgi:hypothetical protein
LESPRLTRLKQEIRARKANALRSFREEITIQGTPSVYQMQLVRLLDTDVWYKTYRMRNDARFFYQFSVDDPNFPFVTTETTRYPTKFQPDPLNSRRYDRFKPNIFSIVELPMALPVHWTTRQSDVPKELVGQITELFKSEILKNERKIFIYKPSGFTTQGPRYPCWLWALCMLVQFLCRWCWTI